MTMNAEPVAEVRGHYGTTQAEQGNESMTESITIKRPNSMGRGLTMTAGGDHRLPVIAIFDPDFDGDVTELALALTPADAHALATWIQENVPKPPTGRERFDALPLGGLFTLGSSRVTRIKTGEDTFVMEESVSGVLAAQYSDADWDTFEEVTQP